MIYYTQTPSSFMCSRYGYAIFLGSFSQQYEKILFRALEMIIVTSLKK